MLRGVKGIGCIIVAEEDCDGEVFNFETQKEADAFCKGVSTGANLYGCGGCSAYTRDDLKRPYGLDPEDEDDAEVIAFIEKFLPKDGA